MTEARRTEDLIQDLASLPAPQRFNPAASLGGMALLLVVMLGLFFAVFGLRADIASSWQHLPVQAKTILPVLLSAAAIWLALRSSRPEQRARAPSLWTARQPGAMEGAAHSARGGHGGRGEAQR